MPSLAGTEAGMLVIAVARIGDSLLATPVMRAIKQAHPQRRLSVLAHPKRVEVLRHLPFIDELCGIDKWRAIWRGRLSAPRQAAAVVFGRDVALVRYALRVSDRVVSYDEPGFPQDHALTRVPTREGMHAVLDRLRLAEALGVQAAGTRLAYRVSDAEKAFARTALVGRWPRPEGLLVGLQMSSFPTKPHRDWPAGHFCDLATRLVKDFPDTRFVVLGDRYAREAAAAFVEAHGGRTLLAAGRTRLREAAALIAEVDLYIGVDTGPTHIAGALGVPMVALYHCLYPGRNLAPLDHPACRVIEHPLTGDAECGEQGMEAITVDEVHRAAAELLTRPLTRIRSGV